MLRLTTILGNAADLSMSERLHRLAHRGRVEYVTLGRDDMQRRRLRVATDKGRECAIALERSSQLFNGAVLQLESDWAIVVRFDEVPWLSLAPTDMAAAVELGYFAGNMHWKVKFDGPVLKIALDGPEQEYLDRLVPLMSGGRVRQMRSE